MDWAVVRHNCMLCDRRGVRPGRWSVVVPRPWELCDARGPGVGNDGEKLAFGKMAFRQSADLVGARIYHLLAVGVGRWYGGYRCVLRVHERCVVLKPFHHGDQQYFGSESRFGLA